MPRHPPQYPEITEAQYSVLVALTDQRCANVLEAADFIADLSPEAREFLRTADKEKINSLIANMDFYAQSRAVWRFLWIGGGVLFTIMVGAAQAWKAFSEYFTFKVK